MRAVPSLKVLKYGAVCRSTWAAFDWLTPGSYFLNVIRTHRYLYIMKCLLQRGSLLPHTSIILKIFDFELLNNSYKQLTYHDVDWRGNERMLPLWQGLFAVDVRLVPGLIIFRSTMALPQEKSKRLIIFKLMLQLQKTDPKPNRSCSL